MAVFAHPDDESGIGGTLARYADQGLEVSLVCATRGEAGEISDPALATPATLGEVREEEMETACQILGIQHLFFLDYCDSGMEGTDENSRQTAFIQADVDEVRAKIVCLIRELKPDIFITFEPFGWYGHPDHRAISRWASEAFYLAGDVAAYPEKGATWQPQRLFHAVLPFSHFETILEETAKADELESNEIIEGVPREQWLKTEAAVTHVMDVTPYFDVKYKATLAHRTQFDEEHIFRTIPLEELSKAMSVECFIQVHPPPPASWTEEPLTDLLT